MAEMFAHMATLDRATTARDTRAMLAFVDADPAADGKRVGAVGYCMSGPFVMWAAADFPERIALHRLDPRRQHGDRQGRLAAPDGAEDPVRELLRVRRDRQVGAAAPTSTSSRPRCATPARRTASSGIPASSTASCFRCASASTTKPPPSGTGSACSPSSVARCGGRGSTGRERRVSS